MVVYDKPTKLTDEEQREIILEMISNNKEGVDIIEEH